MRIGVVINPNSRKNRKQPPGRAERIRRILGAAGEARETESIAAVAPAVRDLIERNVDYLVSDGGDGAMNWMLNAAYDLAEAGALGGRPLPLAVPTNGGTIDFVAQKAGIHGEGLSIVRALVGSLERGEPLDTLTLDSLEIDGIEVTASGERRFRRIGFALAAGGIGRRFFDKYYESRDPGAGTIVSVVVRAVASRLVASLRLPLPEHLLAYGKDVFRPTRARVVIDGEELPTRVHGAIHAGAFEISYGRVFRVFPLAKEPGVLHFQAGEILPSEIIRALPDLHRGRAIRSRRMRDVSGHVMEIEAEGGELLSPIIDGEPFGEIRRMTVRAGPPVRVARVLA
jgi:diacylglycerol kinase family enzyme